MRAIISGLSVVFALLVVQSSSFAQDSQDEHVNIMYGFVPDPERMTFLRGEEIQAIFSGKRVRGIYDVFRESDQRYVEDMTVDGQALYYEGDLHWTGVWFTRRNDLCFRYRHQGGYEHCFKVYTYGDCILQYDARDVLGYVPLDIARWNAVKQVVEDEYEWPDVPVSEAQPMTCELAIS